MCDIGRYGFHRFEEIERLTQPMVQKGETWEAIDWEEAIQKAADLMEKSMAKPLVSHLRTIPMKPIFTWTDIQGCLGFNASNIR